MKAPFIFSINFEFDLFLLKIFSKNMKIFPKKPYLNVFQIQFKMFLKFKIKNFFLKIEKFS